MVSSTQSPVIHLTGAPASGKTTAASKLRDCYGIDTISYGEILTERTDAVKFYSGWDMLQKS